MAPYDDETGIYFYLFISGSANTFFISDLEEFKNNLNNNNYSSSGGILDIEMYDYGKNSWKIASIWEESDKSQKTTFGISYRVDFCTLMDMHDTESQKGYKIITWQRLYTP